MKIKFIFLSFVAFFLTYSLIKGIYIYFDRYNIYKQLSQKEKTLEKKKIELQTKIKKVKSLDYLEKIIREKLQLAQPGETIVILPYPTPTSAVNEKKQDIPSQWLEIFK